MSSLPPDDARVTFSVGNVIFPEEALVNAPSTLSVERGFFLVLRSQNKAS